MSLEFITEPSFGRVKFSLNVLNYSFQTAIMLSASKMACSRITIKNAGSMCGVPAALSRDDTLADRDAPSARSPQHVYCAAANPASDESA